MAKLRYDPDRAAADKGTISEDEELPDWLAALRPADGAAASPNSERMDTASRPPAERRVTPPAHSHEAAPALLAEDDLPAWLRKLSEAAPAGESATPPPAPGTLPAWVSPEPIMARQAGAAAPAPEAAPPVWAPPDTRPVAQEPTGAAIFAELTGAQVSGIPIELDTPSPAPAQPARPWWWFAVAAVVVLLAVAVVFLLLTR